MCGILGILPFNDADMAIEDMRQQLLTMLWVSEARGDEATGVFRGGESPMIVKGNVPASTFVYTKQYNSLFDVAAPVIAHTRKSTIGEPSNNHNNHPLQVGPYVAIHNGSLRNKLEPDDTPGTVDSRYFPWILNKEHPSEHPDRSGIRQIIKSLEGTFALCWTDLRSPDVYYLIRDDVDDRAVYIIETSKYVRFTQIKEPGLEEVPPHTLVQINLATKAITTSKFNFKNVPDELIEFIGGLAIPENLMGNAIKDFIKQRLEEDYKGANTSSNNSVPTNWSRTNGWSGYGDY
jgi:glutamine phosphoribosylpyrophosphate amidotransferase